jgi:hypothetical protein
MGLLGKTFSMYNRFHGGKQSMKAINPNVLTVQVFRPHPVVDRITFPRYHLACSESWTIGTWKSARSMIIFSGSWRMMGSQSY